MIGTKPFFIAAGIIALLISVAVSAGLDKKDTADAFSFDDSPLKEPLEHPDWFKHSFLDLQEDLDEALVAGKRGIIVYFGQKRCAYCQMLMKVNFGREDIVAYTRRHFDVIPIDIWGVDEVTTLKDETLIEREYAIAEKTNFTPSLIFYDRNGRPALRLRGYYPPYKFRAALEYVADGHYQRESFADYLARAEGAPKFEPGELNEEPFFLPPPLDLDRSRIPGERPLVVFFEQGNCHACDVLHAGPLRQPALAQLFTHFDNVQIDIASDLPVRTPVGVMTTAAEWARDLGLFYTPTLLFFDPHGQEIIRVDSVVGFYRLRNVLNYINSDGYQTEPDYQRWRISHGF
ncbi:MAG TPA: thioredoxin [Chromatiales bacterium]|nr:thioredoxin [Chromatiales bacterium]